MRNAAPSDSDSKTLQIGPGERHVAYPYERKFKSRITSVVESLGIPIARIGSRSMQEAAFHAKDWQAQQK